MAMKDIDVRKIARLARIDLDSEQAARLEEQLSKILLYIRQLNEINTDDVVPTSYAVSVGNVFRDDVSRPSLKREDVLANAPAGDGVFITVPRIIE